MGKIQTDAKDIILSLANDSWTLLDRDQQRIAATWIALTVMVREFEDLPTQATKSKERLAFYNSPSQPPEGWSIWIGRYKNDGGVGTNHCGWHIGIKSPGSISKNIECNSQVTGFAVGGLFAIAYSSTVLPILNFGVEANTNTVQIWPRICIPVVRPAYVHSWDSWNVATRFIPSVFGIPPAMLPISDRP